MTSLRVVVVDANDNAPEFTDRRPILVKTRLDGAASNIAKFAQPNLYLGKINVQDRDSGDNGRVSLRVLPPMDRLFSINDNGELRINGIPVLAHIGAHRLAIVARFVQYKKSFILVGFSKKLKRMELKSMQITVIMELQP
jgi:hypothetical protein